jgi:serine/threonine protein kinase
LIFLSFSIEKRRLFSQNFDLPAACVSPLPRRRPLQDPKDRDRVDRECRVMRNLSNHVGVVRLYECVETRDHVYVMMEAAARGWAPLAFFHSFFFLNIF